MSMSNYPPGVSGNEPQITGEWPCDECDGKGFEDDGESKSSCDYCEGKGFISGDEKYFSKTYVCDCGGDVKYDENVDDWRCAEMCNDGRPAIYDYHNVLYDLKEKR